jgi:hypothetical protein
VKEGEREERTPRVGLFFLALDRFWLLKKISRDYSAYYETTANTLGALHLRTSKPRPPPPRHQSDAISRQCQRGTSRGELEGLSNVAVDMLTSLAHLQLDF